MHTPRGHYAKSTQLRIYFQSMVWLGRMSFTLNPKPERRDDSRRDLACASLVALAIRAGGASLIAELNSFDDLLTALIVCVGYD